MSADHTTYRTLFTLTDAKDLKKHNNFDAEIIIRGSDITQELHWEHQGPYQSTQHKDPDHNLNVTFNLGLLI